VLKTHGGWVAGRETDPRGALARAGHGDDSSGDRWRWAAWQDSLRAERTERRDQPGALRSRARVVRCGDAHVRVAEVRGLGTQQVLCPWHRSVVVAGVAERPHVAAGPRSGRDQSVVAEACTFDFACTRTPVHPARRIIRPEAAVDELTTEESAAKVAPWLPERAARRIVHGRDAASAVVRLRTTLAVDYGGGTYFVFTRSKVTSRERNVPSEASLLVRTPRCTPTVSTLTDGRDVPGGCHVGRPRRVHFRHDEPRSRSAVGCG